MNGLSSINAVALARGYKSREEMIELTGVVPDAIDDDDQRTWPSHKVERVITIKCLAGGSFRVEDGDRWNEGLTFDELLGVIAALTMPDHRPCLKWLETKEQHDAREEHYAQLRKQRQTKTPTP